MTYWERIFNKLKILRSNHIYFTFMNTNNTDNKLTTEPIPRLLKIIALPAMVGFFFNTMYNVVDTWVAGQISDEALAALSLTFPVLGFQA